MPTFPLAATVPRTILPFSADTSVHVAGQLPASTIATMPDGSDPPPPPIGTTVHVFGEEQTLMVGVVVVMYADPTTHVAGSEAPAFTAFDCAATPRDTPRSSTSQSRRDIVTVGNTRP